MHGTCTCTPQEGAKLYGVTEGECYTIDERDAHRAARFYINSWSLVGIALAGAYPGEEDSLHLLLQTPIDPELVKSASSVKEAISAIAVNSGNIAAAKFTFIYQHQFSQQKRAELQR